MGMSCLAPTKQCHRFLSWWFLLAFLRVRELLAIPQAKEVWALGIIMVFAETETQTEKDRVLVKLKPTPWRGECCDLRSPTGEVGRVLLLPTDLESQIALSFSASQRATKAGGLLAAVAVVAGGLTGLCGWAPALRASSFLRTSPQSLNLWPFPLPGHLPSPPQLLELSLPNLPELRRPHSPM